MLPAGAEDRVYAMLKQIGFHLWHPALESRAASGRLLVLDGLTEFREHLGGELSITLLADLGRGEDVHEIDEAGVARAITWLRRKEIGQ
jgi:3-dehydroquinate synthase